MIGKIFKIHVSNRNMCIQLKWYLYGQMMCTDVWSTNNRLIYHWTSTIKSSCNSDGTYMLINDAQYKYVDILLMLLFDTIFKNNLRLKVEHFFTMCVNIYNDMKLLFLFSLLNGTLGPDINKILIKGFLNFIMFDI